MRRHRIAWQSLSSGAHLRGLLLASTGKRIGCQRRLPQLGPRPSHLRLRAARFVPGRACHNCGDLGLRLSWWQTENAGL